MPNHPLPTYYVVQNKRAPSECALVPDTVKDLGFAIKVFYDGHGRKVFHGALDACITWARDIHGEALVEQFMEDAVSWQATVDLVDKT